MFETTLDILVWIKKVCPYFHVWKICQSLYVYLPRSSYIYIYIYIEREREKREIERERETCSEVKPRTRHSILNRTFMTIYVIIHFFLSFNIRLRRTFVFVFIDSMFSEETLTGFNDSWHFNFLKVISNKTIFKKFISLIKNKSYFFWSELLRF